MKTILLIAAMILCLAACGGEGSSGNGSAVQALQVGQTAEGTINPIKDVDWYHLSAVEANSVLNIKCTGTTTNPEVALSVTVFADDNGRIGRRLFGAEAPDNAYRPADIDMNIPVSTPASFFIAVRDHMDDDASDTYQYRLATAYQGNGTGGDTFADAVSITVDDPATCQTDSIAEVGDADCFTFRVDTAGVYAVNVTFQPLANSPIHLGFDIYDENGTTIESLQTAQLNSYNMVHYLTAGRYYVVVDDQGRDDADPSSPYIICVTSVTVQEAMGNDSAATADAMSAVAGSANPTYAAQGALAYKTDEDWYTITLTDAGPGLFRVLRITFDDDRALIGDFNYLLEVRDENQNVALSHYIRTGAPPFTSQILAGAGDYYVTVSAAPGQPLADGDLYTVTVEVLEISDPPESAGDGNDDIAAADELISGNPSTGKIAYRGDEDWFKIDVTATAAEPQILELFFDTQQASLVDYTVNIMLGDELKRLADNYGEDGPTRMKTSLYVTANSTYYFKVIDGQADDGDDAQYSLQANVVPVPLADPPAKDGETTFYFSEIYERAMAATDYIDVELEIYSRYQPHFNTNTTLLEVDALDASNQWTSDWIAGYIDYQGDQDFFQLDIAPMGSDTQWYYDIEITLYAPGSDVEYTWKLYRDRASGSNPPNGIVIERTPGTDDILNFEDQDGVIAAYADPDLTSQVLDVTIPDAGQPFWIGDGWQNDRFYLGISDFNYVNLDSGGGQMSANPIPDDDWGHNAPYYFKVTLTYHPGESTPPAP